MLKSSLGGWAQLSCVLLLSYQSRTYSFRCSIAIYPNEEEGEVVSTQHFKPPQSALRPFNHSGKR